MVVHSDLVCRATGQAGAETLTDCAPSLTCDHEAPIIANCMWGNGMALPNALFVVRRIVTQLTAERCVWPENVKLGSLFDGSGTMPLAAEMCGARAVWASEVEPYPIAVTKTHLPYMKHLGDIRHISGAELEPVDVIAFGSPCQDLSIAGQRAGLDGERSGLFREAVRIIKEMRMASGGACPRFAIWENVPGALSSNGGKDFETVLNELLGVARPNECIRQHGRWATAGNYGAIAYRIVDAQYWGVPQRRRRIYLVADFAGESAAEIIFERKGAPWNFKPRIPAGQRIAALPPDCYQYRAGMEREAESYSVIISGGENGSGGKGANVARERSYSLTAVGEKQTIFSCGFMAGQSAKAGSVAAAEEKAPAIRAADSGTNQSPTVVSMMGNVIDRQATQNGIGIREDGKSYTLDTVSRHGVAYRQDGKEKE